MTKPAWLERLEYYEAQGFAEIPGSKSNPKIVAWMTGPGKGAWVKSDATPWCGGCMAGILDECNLSDRIPKDPLAAKNWLNLPDKLSGPRVGAIAVFKRTGGHHVTVVKSFDDDNLYCIGGNQRGDNQIDRIGTDRYSRNGPNKPLGYRWPVSLVTPQELAQTSRIAASAERQNRDQKKAQAMFVTAPAPEVVTPPPPGWRQSVDGMLGDVGWAKSVLTYGVDFGGFVGANWTWIALAIAGFYFGRNWWDTRKIRSARLEDAIGGWTT